MEAVLRSEELSPSEGSGTQIRRVRVGESHVLLARLTTGEVVGFGPSCPHQFTELDEATIWDGNLRCPRHSYLFDTRTGENIHPRRDAPDENLWKLRPGYLRCFPVREVDGWIWVSGEERPPPASYDPALERRPEGSALPDPSGSPPAGSAAAPAAGPAPARTAAAGAAPAPGVGVPSQSVKFLDAVAGATFELRLPIVPRPGHEWRFDVVGSLLAVVGERFEPGYSPCYVLDVAAEGAGAATLTGTYAREGGEVAEVRTFIVRVRPG